MTDTKETLSVTPAEAGVQSRCDLIPNLGLKPSKGIQPNEKMGHRIRENDE